MYPIQICHHKPTEHLALSCNRVEARYQAKMKHHINNRQMSQLERLIDLDFLIHSDSIRFIYLLYTNSLTYLHRRRHFSHHVPRMGVLWQRAAVYLGSLPTGASKCSLSRISLTLECVTVSLAESLGMFLQKFAPNIVTCYGIPWASGRSLFVGTSKETAISFSTEQLTQCPPVSHSLLSTLPGRHLNPHHIPVT